MNIWDSELPRIELYGTKGTICVNDIDPLDGPNLFGGQVLLKKMKDYRWKNMPRTKTERSWESMPVTKQFSETSHDKNSRGIGLVDMAYAIREGRKERASGDMALYSFEVLESLLKSAKQQHF